jgi:hypothetical protein
METKLKIRKMPIADLRPTQMTVGYHAVKHKRRQWREVSDSKRKRREFIEDHVIPVVIGPKGALFATDHHHVARALLEEGVDEALVGIHGDLSALPKWTFWNFMDQRSWCRPCDDHGRRRDFDDIPKTLADLLDDPYRSLAAAVERAGGYAKETMPFSEFLWADFFRTHVRRTTLEADFDQAVEKALVLARSPDADYLPGWCATPKS